MTDILLDMSAKTMLVSKKDAIAFRNTHLLKAQNASKHLNNFLVVAWDTEYTLPVFNPYASEQLKDRYGITELPPEVTHVRPVFRTHQLACKGNVTHWKPDRQISTAELCSWILRNLETWKIDYRKQYKAIVVCSHYLLAEIQHLTDCKEVFKSFGSMLYGEFDFDPETDWDNFNPNSPSLEVKEDQIKFRFLDTFALFGMKLETLTQGTPYPKHRDDDIWHGKPWSWWRANPEKFFAEDEVEFWKYADNDCLSLEWCVLHWGRWLWDRWKIDILWTKTFSNIGLRILKSQITEPTEPYLKQQCLSKSGRPKTEIVYDPSKTHIRDFFLDGYWGNRREVGERGFISGPIYAYDVSKEYTTAAIMQPMSNAHTDFLKNELDDSSDLSLYEGVAEVRFEFPKTIDYPCLPVTDKRFPLQLYPRTGVSVCGLAEIRLAKKLGAKIWIIRSCVFKPTQEEINHPLRKFLKEILALANDFKQNGDKAGETFMKNIANGIIGKLIQRNKVEKQELKWKDYAENASKTSWSPILACLILSRARAIYGEILTLGTPVYGHTDSVFSKTKIDQNAPILQALRENGSEGLKLEHEFETFWTPRAACYYGRTKDGVVKIARGGLSGQNDVFVKAIESKLGNPDAPNRTIFLSVKMATFKDKNLAAGLLGHEIVTIRDTPFEYDHKRKLLNPEAKLWSESSKTRAWESIEELLSEVSIKKDSKHRKLADGYETQTGLVGRPKVVIEEDRLEMVKMLKERQITRNKIALQFKDKYARQTIYSVLKDV